MIFMNINDIKKSIKRLTIKMGLLLMADNCPVNVGVKGHCNASMSCIDCWIKSIEFEDWQRNEVLRLIIKHKISE